MTADALTLSRLLTPPPVDVVRPALFLDLDGVLAEMQPMPDDVVPHPRRTALLRRLNAVLDGRVAVISGRTISEIDRITEGASPSASGVHGLELRRAGGALERATPHPAVASVLEQFHAFAVGKLGMVVEDKGISAGLHYRAAPDHAEAARALATRLAAETGLTLQHGHLVVELKTPGTSKGSAVRAFTGEPTFLGATPIMLGDDLTDEHGFEAARALGGFGVLVGPERDTAATHRLENVDAVLDWLEAVAEAQA